MRVLSEWGEKGKQKADKLAKTTKSDDAVTTHAKKLAHSVKLLGVVSNHMEGGSVGGWNELERVILELVPEVDGVVHEQDLLQDGVGVPMAQRRAQKSVAATRRPGCSRGGRGGGRGEHLSSWHRWRSSLALEGGSGGGRGKRGASSSRGHHRRRVGGGRSGWERECARGSDRRGVSITGRGRSWR